MTSKKEIWLFKHCPLLKLTQKYHKIKIFPASTRIPNIANQIAFTNIQFFKRCIIVSIEPPQNKQVLYTSKCRALNTSKVGNIFQAILQPNNESPWRNLLLAPSCPIKFSYSLHLITKNIISHKCFLRKYNIRYSKPYISVQKSRV